LNLGKRGELAAADFLKHNGYKVIFRNYKSRLGEIDIIAKDGDTVCFIEVKARSSEKFGLPQEALSPFKQRQIGKVALWFLKQNNLLDKKARFDVVSLVYLGQSPKIVLFKNAFDLDQSFTY